MRTGHKQYFIRYESDQKICGEYDHFGGNASTIKNAKAIISSIRNGLADKNPRNFRVYDSYGEIQEGIGFVPCVYNVD